MAAVLEPVVHALRDLPCWQTCFEVKLAKAFLRLGVFELVPVSTHVELDAVWTELRIVIEIESELVRLHGQDLMATL
jgi:hypothetical protein